MNEDEILRDLINSSASSVEMETDKPTEITIEDIDKFFQGLLNGDYDAKPRPCFSCSKSHFPSYGSAIGECDECWFSRFPKEQVTEFYRSFFE